MKANESADSPTHQNDWPLLRGVMFTKITYLTEMSRLRYDDKFHANKSKQAKETKTDLLENEPLSKQ